MRLIVVVRFDLNRPDDLETRPQQVDQFHSARLYLARRPPAAWRLQCGGQFAFHRRRFPSSVARPARRRKSRSI
jgi:hypothetical protein